MANSMERAQLHRKHLANPKREMKHKTMKMKVGSAASKVRFIAWRHWSRNGKPWAGNLCSVYQSTWKKAGIYDAILASQHPINKRQDNLILELASRWCSKTNTFILPCGEATITLEDVMVIGGFSVTGVTSLNPPKNDSNLVEIEERLELARKEIQRGKSRKATHSGWLKKFMATNCDIEHEAFLMYWLSRFVFPTSTSDVVNRKIFHIAIRLSRGIKFALARPVLGTLYKELTAMNIMLMNMASDLGNSNVQLDVFAPFHIVQIWAWERLPLLKPEKSIHFNEDLPRVAKWSDVKDLKGKDLSYAMESFVWCPYGESDKECLTQFLKASKLEGFDCVEKYMPQRVARQFGLVQDIPTDHGDELTKQVNFFKDYKMYVASSLAKPAVTPRYQDWWKLQRSVKLENSVDYGPPPGFPPRVPFSTIDDSDDDSDFDFDTGSDSTFTFASFSDSESFEFEGADFSTSNGDKHEESRKQNVQPASTSKTLNIKKEEEEDEQENLPSGFNSGVIAIDDSSEDDNETEYPFTQPELPRRFDFVNKLKERQIENVCEKCTCSKQDSRDGTEARAQGLDEAVNAVRHNEISMNVDAESFTDERINFSNFNLDARINRLEKIVFAQIGLGTSGK